MCVKSICLKGSSFGKDKSPNAYLNTIQKMKESNVQRSRECCREEVERKRRTGGPKPRKATGSPGTGFLMVPRV